MCVCECLKAMGKRSHHTQARTHTKPPPQHTCCRNACCIGPCLRKLAHKPRHVKLAFAALVVHVPGHTRGAHTHTHISMNLTIKKQTKQNKQAHACGHSLLHSPFHSLTHSLSHTHTLFPSLSHSLTRSLAHSLTLSHTHSLSSLPRPHAQANLILPNTARSAQP